MVNFLERVACRSEETSQQQSTVGFIGNSQYNMPYSPSEFSPYDLSGRDYPLDEIHPSFPQFDTLSVDPHLHKSDPGDF